MFHRFMLPSEQAEQQRSTEQKGQSRNRDCLALFRQKDLESFGHGIVLSVQRSMRAIFRQRYLHRPSTSCLRQARDIAWFPDGRRVRGAHRRRFCGD